MERWGGCVGEVGFDGLSMGDRGRSRRIYLVAVFSGVFAASALNADIGSPPDSVCAAYAPDAAYMQSLEGVLWDFFELRKSPYERQAEYLNCD